MAKTKDQTDAPAETSIENPIDPEATAPAETSIENPIDPEATAPADQSLEGQNPTAGEGATGADSDAPPPVTIGTLRVLLTMIESRNTDLHRDHLFAVLIDNHGATGDLDTMSMTLAGVTSSVAVTNDLNTVLTNWCNAARRKILSGAVPE